MYVLFEPRLHIPRLIFLVPKVALSYHADNINLLLYVLFSRPFSRFFLGRAVAGNAPFLRQKKHKKNSNHHRSKC